MVKLFVTEDEWWPHYEWSTNVEWSLPDAEVEISQSELEWIQRVSWEYSNVQDFLRKKSGLER